MGDNDDGHDAYITGATGITKVEGSTKEALIHFLAFFSKFDPKGIVR